MDMVAVDILSGLPTADDGSTCILVVGDYMTKWTERMLWQTMRLRHV